MSKITELVNQKVWAVVGANNNREKFGYKIYKFMLDAGYQVYPVNPGLTEVLGNKCYASLKDLPVKPDVVDFVVPAKVGEQVVRECAELGIQQVWLQPGADSASVIKLAEELGLNVTCACIMAEARKHGIGLNS
ncbi:MAG: CoA-binding protein [Negativicutes bacterium]|nr:CoA-binding protein [Negativicutes bacterium]